MNNQGFISARPTPAKQEVFAAIHRSLDANGERLLQGGSLDSQASVTVVDSFRIVTMNLQGNSGIAELEVKQMGVFQQGEVVPKRETARLNMILSRQEQGWVLVMPQNLVHLDRSTAMAVTARQSTATRSITPVKQSAVAGFR